ncbi:MAG: BlaI/MecI/CopY family transcriptional regulator [Lachnospiraceae bacterium]|jgi:predicted transcriptional regulator|nr:BlaI/MecI/CopY family transcriptional regulator [Lachnospiraceae bacterium]
MANERANLSKTEARIMNFMWAVKKPVVLAEVKEYFREKYNKPYANSTIHTLLQRMVKKGYIAQGEKYIAFSGYSYRCVVSEEEYMLEQMEMYRNTFFDGSAGDFILSLMKMQEMTAEELDRIGKYVQERKMIS